MICSLVQCKCNVVTLSYAGIRLSCSRKSSLKRSTFIAAGMQLTTTAQQATAQCIYSNVYSCCRSTCRCHTMMSRAACAHTLDVRAALHSALAPKRNSSFDASDSCTLVLLVAPTVAAVAAVTEECLLRGGVVVPAALRIHTQHGKQI
jgi:hypothetical protein